MIVAIPFPPLDPVALRLGPLAVRWYGLAYLAGFVAAGLLIRWASKRWRVGFSVDDILTMVLFAVGGVLLGGRLGYVVLYNLKAYVADPLEILAIWDGGMSFHGAAIGLFVAGLAAAAYLKVPFLLLGDLVAVGIGPGLFFGRLANFVNAELWGRVTDVPWAVVFPGAGPVGRHPSQLYEALLEGVVLSVVLIWMGRRPRPRGLLFGVLLAGYGVARIAVEFFREPDVQIGFLAGGVTMGQLLSVPMVVIGAALIVWALRPGRPLDGPVAGR
jgi:phosphatidylglycerol:prolipoprotein diacylglycerol transferase